MVEIINQINNTMKAIIKAINELREGVNPDKIAIELENYVRLNTSFPKKSFKWYNYTKKTQHDTALTGVLHTVGYKVATDGFVLLACKEDYDKGLEGKIIDSNGKIIESKYPNWEGIIPEIMTINVVIPLDYSRMKEAIKRCKMIQKVNKTKRIFIRVDCEFFYYKDMERFLMGAEKIGAKDMRFTSPDRKRTPMFAKNKNGTVLIMGNINDIEDDIEVKYNKNTGGYEDRDEYGLNSYTTDY